MNVMKALARFCLRVRLIATGGRGVAGGVVSPSMAEHGNALAAAGHLTGVEIERIRSHNAHRKPVRTMPADEPMPICLAMVP